jgi:hypothetical protein
VEKDIQVLPMLPPTIANAINYGRETITMSVSREFDNYQAPALVADYSVNSLPGCRTRVLMYNLSTDESR